MGVEISGIEELMWGSIRVKKDEILKNDSNFLVTKAENLLSENSFRLFSTYWDDPQIEVSGTPIKVDLSEAENNEEDIQKDEFRLDVYEFLENSRVYSDQDVDPSNLELKINTSQHQALFARGYETFKEDQYEFFANGKSVDVTLESESSGSVRYKLMYLKDEEEFFVIDLEDSEDIEEMFSEIQDYLKG